MQGIDHVYAMAGLLGTSELYATPQLAISQGKHRGHYQYFRSSSQEQREENLLSGNALHLEEPLLYYQTLR